MNEELSVNFSRPWVIEILASLDCDAWDRRGQKCTLDEKIRREILLESAQLVALTFLASRVGRVVFKYRDRVVTINFCLWDIPKIL